MYQLICRRCGRIEDVDRAVGETTCLGADDGSGFRIDEAEVTYWGLCPACAADRDTSHRSTAQL